MDLINRPLYSHAGRYPESGCDGGQDSDSDVENLAPDRFVCFHVVYVFSLD